MDGVRVKAQRSGEGERYIGPDIGCDHVDQFGGGQPSAECFGREPRRRNVRARGIRKLESYPSAVEFCEDWELSLTCAHVA